MGNENGSRLYKLGHHLLQSPTPLDSDKNTTFMSHPQNQIHHLYANNNQIASGIPSKSTTGSNTVMAVSGKLLFTATQWEELERQTMIFKYMMASIPVPPQLLAPLSTQSNRGGMGLKSSNGSDPEPWRCRRTDGKKWRCSKDVAPDHKYCEHHAHKSRPRSRKPVEILPSSHVNNTNNYKNPRCSGLFMKNGIIPVSESKRDPIFKQDFKGNYPFLNTSDTRTGGGDAAAGARRQQFIDSWSRIGNGDDCSLSLSMQSGGNGMKFEDDESFRMDVGMLDGGRGSRGDLFRSHDDNHQHQHWLNQPCWAGSTPGGPLGEALCLGIASTTNTAPNASSPRGDGNHTTISGSCVGGDGRGYGFIR